MHIRRRLDDARLAEALVERELVEASTAKRILSRSECEARPLSLLLLEEELVRDWELSRVASELFGLPFVTVEAYEPSAGARRGLDPEFLLRHGLVPLDRFGDLLVVLMPAAVTSDILGELALQAGAQVTSMVGSTESNCRWLAENLGPSRDGRLSSRAG